MKKIFFPFVCLSIILSACIGGNSFSKNKPKFEYGKVVNQTYKNNFLGLEVSLPETWTVDTSKKFKTHFSPHFLEADLFDENQNALISLNILGEKKNPFSDKTLIEHLKESNENFNLLYEKNEHRETLEKVEISKTNFIRNRIELVSSGQTVYMDEYATDKNGYFYSMTFSYTDTLDRNAINPILEKIKIK